MNKFFTICIGTLLTVNGGLVNAAEDAGTTTTALSCTDFVPTDEALERFPDLVGACEAVVERDGVLYGMFRAVVRRVVGNSVTLYLPVTDHTFRANPASQARVLLDGVKARPRDLERGQEIHIYLAAKAFSTPNIEEVSFVTESELIIEHEVEPVVALPTTG